MARQSGSDSTIKSQIADLEKKQSREGLSSAESSLLDDLRLELNLRRYEREEEERRKIEIARRDEEERERKSGRNDGGR